MLDEYAHDASHSTRALVAEALDERRVEIADVISNNGPLAVQAMKNGALDFIFQGDDVHGLAEARMQMSNGRREHHHVAQGTEAHR